MADANKRIIQRLFEESWTGNFDAIDEFISPDYVGHDPSEQEPTRGPDGLKEFIERYRSAFEGVRLIVDDQFAEGDKVATRWSARGTHSGEISGIAPTGKDVTVTGMTISRFAGGKVVEEWSTWDTLGMLVQLGVIPAPARAWRSGFRSGRPSRGFPLVRKGHSRRRRIRIAAERRCRASSLPSTCPAPSAGRPCT